MSDTNCVGDEKLGKEMDGRVDMSISGETCHCLMKQKDAFPVAVRGKRLKMGDTKHVSEDNAKNGTYSCMDGLNEPS